MRDLSLEGDKTSESSFKYLHLASVLLYLLNMLLVVSIFVIISLNNNTSSGKNIYHSNVSL